MADPIPSACPFDGYASPILQKGTHANDGTPTFTVICPVCRIHTPELRSMQAAVDAWGARVGGTYTGWEAAFEAWLAANPPTADLLVANLFGATVPATPDAGDATGNELGVAFKSSVAGSVAGVRFYKSALNTGAHVGNLWTLDGSNLSTVTFTGETSSGWQEARFPTPISITPGTNYVVSVYCPNGHYAATGAYFATTDLVAGVLTAPATGNVTIGNGRFIVSFGFPTNTFNGGNYWVDAIFEPVLTYTTWKAALAAWLAAHPPVAD
jgi:Domain of unknown function (DUF4082)